MVASRNASSTGSEYGCAPPEIEKLITFTPSRIACCTADTESELKQPCRSADAVHDHVGSGCDAADRAPLDAVQHGRGDAVARGGRAWCACRDPRGHAASTRVSCRCRTPGRPSRGRPCRWPSSRTHRSACCCTRTSGRDARRRCRRRSLAALQASGRSRQAAGGEHRVLRPDAGVDHADRSMSSPALAEPPSDGQTVVAPMNDVLSSCGWLSVSSWTAATPGTLSSSSDGVRRDRRGDAAVDGLVVRADLGLGNLGLDRAGDQGSLPFRIVVVGGDRAGVLIERDTGHGRARRGEARRRRPRRTRWRRSRT